MVNHSSFHRLKFRANSRESGFVGKRITLFTKKKANIFTTTTDRYVIFSNNRTCEGMLPLANVSRKAHFRGSNLDQANQGFHRTIVKRIIRNGILSLIIQFEKRDKSLELPM